MVREQEGRGIGRRTLLAAAPALLAAGCAPRAAGDGLRFWATGYEGDYAPFLMTAFTAATGVPVDTQSLPGTAAHEKYLTAFSGGSLPDILMLPTGWVREFAMIGAIAPLPDATLASDTFPGVVPPLVYRGATYAVPWSIGSQVQFYRRDLIGELGFDTAPMTWDGWRLLGARLKRRHPDRYAILMFLNWWDTLITFATATGAYPLRDDDTRANFQTPQYREALGYYASLFHDGYAPSVSSTELQDPFSAFAAGWFALYPSGPTLLRDLDRRRAELAPEQWGTARMPGPEGPGRVSAINNTLAVSAAAAHKPEAWALVRHLSSAASELQFQQLIGVLPARRSAWAAPQLRAPVLRPFAEQMEAPARVPDIVQWERVRLEVQLVAERVVRGDLTLDGGLAAMDRRVDALLAKRRELVRAGKLA